MKKVIESRNESLYEKKCTVGYYKWLEPDAVAGCLGSVIMVVFDLVN